MKAILVIAFTCLSFSLFSQTKEDSIRWQRLAEQRIAAGKDSVYQQLLRAKRPENYLNPPSLSYSSAPYYTEASRQILLEILKDDWITEEQKRKEAKKRVWQQVNRQIDTYEDVINDTIKYEGFKRKRKHFLTLLDSLKELKRLNVDTVNSFQTAVNRWMQEMNIRRMPDLYIYTSGMLDSTLYLPFLKEALKDTVKYNPCAVKMALARYKINPYQTEMLKEHKIDLKDLRGQSINELTLFETRIAMPRLFYLCSQESVKEYSKLLSLGHFKRIDEDDYSIYSIPSGVLGALSVLILNTDFQEYLRKVNPPDNVTKDHITWVQNWLEKNYGNYELDRNFYPGLR